MGSDIQDLWIIQEHGTVLFKHTQNEKIDEQIFGGFMSALNSFAANFTSTGLHSFELGETRFFLYRKDGLIFIANANKKVKPEKVEQNIKDNANKFIAKYPMEFIQKWDGDVNRFKDFKGILDNSMVKSVNILKNSLW